MEKDNNRKFLPIIIGLITLLVFVIGATYAYYNVTSTNSFNTTTINAQADSNGAVTLTKTSSSLLLELDNANMAETGRDKMLYASTSGTVTTENIETIAQTTIVDDNIYDCGYTLTISEDSIDSLYTAFNSDTNSTTNQFILTINDTSYDLKTNNLFPITYSGSFNIISTNKPGTITASLTFLNKTGVDQTSLSGKDITLELSILSFSCKTIKQNAGIKLIASSPNNLSTEEIGGMYRFQGTSSEVTNNYLIFFGTDKRTDVMCRIIGITPDGQIKVITDDAIGNYVYSSNTSYLWNQSTLYSELSSYVSTYENDEDYEWWVSIMDEKSWGYGNLSAPSTTNFTTLKSFADAIYNSESTFVSNVVSRFGTLYVHDYLYSIPSGSNLYQGSTLLLKSSWLYNDVEWTIPTTARQGWSIKSTGAVGGVSKSTSQAVRLVFYLDKNVILSNAAGTAQDPYIITGLSNNS